MERMVWCLIPCPVNQMEQANNPFNPLHPLTDPFNPLAR
jgi:hypothetical protein